MRQSLLGFIGLRMVFFLLLVVGVVGEGYGQICRPISQTNNIGGVLCVGMSVNSPSLAFDDDPNLLTFATIKNAIGLLCYAEITMTLGGMANGGDSIQVFFGTGEGLLNVELLKNVSVQFKNNGTNVGSEIALNNSLLTLNLLPNGKIASVNIPVNAEVNQIKIQAGGLVSLLVELKLYDVRIKYKSPDLTGEIRSVCYGESITLTANPASGTILKWYDSKENGVPLQIGNTFTSPRLTAAKTYYIGVSRFEGCEGTDRIPVIVNVIPKRSPPELEIESTLRIENLLVNSKNMMRLSNSKH